MVPTMESRATSTASNLLTKVVPQWKMEVTWRHCTKTCGLHVFVFYIIVLTAMLAMSTACLSASDSGYFVFEQKVDRTDDDGVSYNVDYKTDYGWRLMCAEAEMVPKNSEDTTDRHDDSGCFGLDEEATIENEDIELVAGSTMTADTGLAVALGHAVSVLVSATHILFFVLLYFNIDPVPVRGYLYMRGLGLMTALSSFYLLFTCVVSFFFGVKGSLDLHIQTSTGLRPSWAYVMTVINVTLMVVIGTLACQDDEVDAAIATPQYTSSSRNEDTVKRASGKLLQMRSRSSDTICEGTAPPHGQHPPFTAPKATVDTSLSSRTVVGVMSGAHPAVSLAAPGQPGGVNSVSRSSSIAASAAAHGAFGSGSGRVQQSPEPSSSVVTSWTGHASVASPASRANRTSPERAEDGGDEDGDMEDAESGDIRSDRAQVSDRGRRRRRDSGSILDASPLFNSAAGAGDDETNATGEESVTPKIREDEADSEIPEVNVEEDDGNSWRYAIRSDAGPSMKAFDGDTLVTRNEFECLPSSPATQSNDSERARTCASGEAVLAEREDAKTCSSDPGSDTGIGSSGIAGTGTPDPCLSEEDALECGEVPASPLQRVSAQQEEPEVSVGDACGDVGDTTPPPSARRSREECV